MFFLVACSSKNGIFANPAGCPIANFYQCSNWVAFLMSCPTGLYFNALANQCDYLYNIQCSAPVSVIITRPTLPAASTAPTTQNPTIATTTPLPPGAKFVCYFPNWARYRSGKFVFHFLCRSCTFSKMSLLTDYFHDKCRS